MSYVIGAREMVVIESPFIGKDKLETRRNVLYARLCVAHSLHKLHEDPYASHLYLTQTGITDDTDEEERNAGIEAGLRIAERADFTAVYTNLGISSGMRRGISAARNFGRPIVRRSLGSPEEVASMIARLAKRGSSALNEGIPF